MINNNSTDKLNHVTFINKLHYAVEALSRTLAKALNDYELMHTLAFGANNHHLTDNVEYGTKAIPCKLNLEQGTTFIPDGVQQQLSAANNLLQLDVEMARE